MYQTHAHTHTHTYTHTHIHTHTHTHTHTQSTHSSAVSHAVNQENDVLNHQSVTDVTSCSLTRPNDLHHLEQEMTVTELKLVHNKGSQSSNDSYPKDLLLD